MTVKCAVEMIAVEMIAAEMIAVDHGAEGIDD